MEWECDGHLTTKSIDQASGAFWHINNLMKMVPLCKEMTHHASCRVSDIFRHLSLTAFTTMTPNPEQSPQTDTKTSTESTLNDDVSILFSTPERNVKVHYWQKNPIYLQLSIISVRRPDI